MKQCTSCDVTKPLTDFHKNRSTKDGFSGYCKVCREAKRAIVKARNGHVKPTIPRLCPSCGELKSSNDFYRDASRPSGMSFYCKACDRARKDEHREKYPERNARWCRNNSLKQAYKIDHATYERILAHQGGICFLCEKEPVDGERHFSVDHDKRCCPGRTSCGKCIRGIACQGCNTKMGSLDILFELGLLEKAIAIRNLHIDPTTLVYEEMNPLVHGGLNHLNSNGHV